MNPGGQDKTMNKFRILIMEHEERVCRVLCRIIKKMGVDPYSAVDYEHFKSLYKEKKPEIILLSLEINDSSNAEFFRFLVEHKSNATIYLLSTMDDDDLSGFVKLGQSAGLKMGGILRKPLDVDSVKMKLTDLMQGERVIPIKKNLASRPFNTDLMTVLHRLKNVVITMNYGNTCDGII
jgi:DNA-binding response OmpR family regulator